MKFPLSRLVKILLLLGRIGDFIRNLRKKKSA